MQDLRRTRASLKFQSVAPPLALFAEFHTHRSWRLFRRVVTFGPGHLASLHGLLVLALLPLLLSVFSFLRRRGREPSTFSKMIGGYIATAAAFAVMGVASLRDGDRGQVDSIWLSSRYALLSLAELLLAPMSLSLVTQFAPPRQTSRMSVSGSLRQQLAMFSLGQPDFSGGDGRIMRTSPRSPCRQSEQLRFYSHGIDD